MSAMTPKNDGKQIGIRLSSRDLDILQKVIDRVVERSNGLAKPDLSSIFRELASLRPEHYVTGSDRDFVRSFLPVSDQDQSEKNKRLSGKSSPKQKVS